ncbi:hypothetical protein ANCCAN_21138, partial [Ancylostoma caninum]
LLKKFSAILYISPEKRLSDHKNQRRRGDESWVAQTAEKKRAADIYAFGMVLYEILFRSLPFSDIHDLNEMSTKAMQGEKIIRPQVQKDQQLHPDLQALLQDCWHDSPDARPSIRRVRLSTEAILKTQGTCKFSRTGLGGRLPHSAAFCNEERLISPIRTPMNAKTSLVDSMIRVMEEYASNLEKLVNERTASLEETTIRADKLLSQLLPKYVANELKNGRSVPPKMFASATVLFTDVVGFTTLCSSSTPMEVSLNAKPSLVYNVYIKVETIGDAYMVVSGIPEENGKRHVCNVADISLDIMEVCWVLAY